jgi:hypothetical protein
VQVNDSEPDYYVTNHHDPEIAKVLYDQDGFTIRRNPDFGVIISGAVGGVIIYGECYFCPVNYVANHHDPETVEVLYDEAGFTIRRNPDFGVLISGELSGLDLGGDHYLRPSPHTHPRHKD